MFSLHGDLLTIAMHHQGEHCSCDVTSGSPLYVIVHVFFYHVQKAKGYVLSTIHYILVSRLVLYQPPTLEICTQIMIIMQMKLEHIRWHAIKNPHALEEIQCNLTY